MSDQTQQPEVEPEQAAELAALQGMAAAGDAQSDAPQENTQESQKIALAAEISGLLTMFVGMTKPIFPSLGIIYTEEVIKTVGESLEPVCVKHGWLSGGIGGAYGEELLAICVVGPLAFATYNGMKSDIEAKKPQKKIEAVPDMPLGQQTGPTADDKSPLTVEIGKVIPHEN